MGVRCWFVVSVVMLLGRAARAEPTDDDGEESGEGIDPAEDEAEPDDQPPVTAGGLFTIQTYPLTELQRPLTLTKGITQLRLDLGTDVSALTAFEEYVVALHGRYGLEDNLTLL